MNAPGRVSILRLCCVMVGLLCAGGLVELFRIGIGESGLRMLAGLVALALIGAAGWLAARPETWWQEQLGRLSNWLKRDEPASDEFSAKIGIALVVAALLAGIASSWRFNRANDSFHDQDEEAYLTVAQEISDGPGFFGFWSTVYSGEFREANRHPLSLWLMSASPRFELQKHDSGEYALLTFLVVVMLVTRSDGLLTAGCCAVLLGTNAAFLRFSATVACESLLVLIVVGAWFAARGLGRTDGDTRSVPWWLPVLCGLLLGLSWLTKGTGLVLTVAFGAWMLFRLPIRTGSEPASDDAASSAPSPWTDRPRVRRNLIALGIVAGAWILIASPLLVRNARVYGSPFHNVNSWLMFSDRYEDPVALSEQASLGEAARAWWSTHSVVDIGRRQASGLVWESFIIVRMLGPTPLDDARVLPGLLLALLALIGAALSPREERWLLAIWLAACLVLFAWYIPVAAGERFPLPLLIPILILSSRGLVHSVRKLTSTEDRAARALLIAGLAWIAMVEAVSWSGWFDLAGRV